MRPLAILVLALAGCGRVGFEDHVLLENCALTIEPAAARINFNSARTFQGASGIEPYQFSYSGARATLPAGGATLRTGDQPGTGVVTVTDDVGCTAEATVEIGGDTLWYVGGSSMGVPSAQVYKSTDGATWTLAGSLPDKRTNGALYVFDDQLIWATGSDGVGAKTDVFATTDGATWAEIGDVPLASVNPGFAVFHDRMWLIGGSASPDTNAVYSSDAGMVWTQTGTLPEENHGGAVAATADKLWYLGGHNSNTGMLYRWALSSTDGVTFQEPGMLAMGREYASAITIDDTIMIAGGQDTSPTRMDSVLTTRDGVTYTTEAPMPVARAFTTLVRFGDFVYSIGGNDGGGVVRAPVSGGAWTPVVGNFPQPRQGGRAAVFTPGA